MKIAIVSDAIYPYNKGGKEKRIHEISLGLAKKGHEVTLYCMKWWNGENTIFKNNIRYKAVCPYIPLYALSRRSFTEAILFALTCFRLITEDFDILEADHMPHLVLFPLKLISLLKRKKLYVTWNEVWGRAYWKKYVGVMGELAYLIEKASTYIPDVIISVSDHTTQRLKEEFHRSKNVFTIPNAINFHELQHIPQSQKVSDVIFAGRMLSHKNIDVLIEAIRIVKKTYSGIQAFLIGSGPEENTLKNLVKKLQLEKNITFFNFFENHSDVYALIKSSKVFVLPSSREGFGIVILEANALGIPAITVNNKENAAKDLIQENRNGLVCELSSREIAKSILILLRKKNVTVSRKCISFAEKFQWKHTIDQVERMYQI